MIIKKKSEITLTSSLAGTLLVKAYQRYSLVLIFLVTHCQIGFVVGFDTRGLRRYAKEKTGGIQ